MPLLYANKLASIEQLDIDPDLDGRIRQAIERELSRQSASGAFGMWSADEQEDPWLDAFVTDFLTRARERNFTVPQQAFDQAWTAAQRGRQRPSRARTMPRRWLTRSTFSPATDVR